jgi:hypothetical protein
MIHSPRNFQTVAVCGQARTSPTVIANFLTKPIIIRRRQKWKSENCRIFNIITVQYAQNYQICPPKRERWTMKRQKRRALRSPLPFRTSANRQGGRFMKRPYGETDAATITP